MHHLLATLFIYDLLMTITVQCVEMNHSRYFGVAQSIHVHSSDVALSCNWLALTRHMFASAGMFEDNRQLHARHLNDLCAMIQDSDDAHLKNHDLEDPSVQSSSDRRHPEKDLHDIFPMDDCYEPLRQMYLENSPVGRAGTTILDGVG